ncbi:MAG TPA: serine/threonine-protein kinase [Polyangiaceae bacterium]|nr:serine/threonine-protein kinase [Polyangiaceae bacterium]
MPQLAPATDSFVGAALPSEAHPGVRFVLERRLGVGGTAAAYLATRIGPEGQSPAVVKIILPDVVSGQGATAAMVVRKEAVALGRLNEQVPPTPFVVRLMDVGSVTYDSRKGRLELPWLAIEYVNGGLEGTTLEQRMAQSIEVTGTAFERERAARAIGHVAVGLFDVHSVGVIHRDLTPNNILCCGFGDSELFKLSDFGIARPAGLSDTFGPNVVGTPGYISPEQIVEGTSGPQGDIFSLGCMLYFMLTGEHLFDVANVMDMVEQTKHARRRSILDAHTLAAELRADPDACVTLDALIARSTAADPSRRPQSAREIASVAVPLLLERAGSGSRRRRATMMSAQSSPALPNLAWVVRHPSGGDRIVHSVGWDGDGHCLAASTDGLVYWNGSEWSAAPTRDLPAGQGLRFVRRIGPGRWLIGGDHALLAEYSHAGVSRVMRGKDPTVSFIEASGNVSDLAVVVGTRPGHPPALHAAVGGRWLKALPVPQAAYIAGLTQVDEERWLVVGRSVAGGGFVALYSPLSWHLEPLQAPPTRAWVSCSARTERDIVIAVGAEGSVLRMQRGVMEGHAIAEGPNLASVSVDLLDREWAGATGEIWCSVAGAAWSRVWEDRSWTRPFVSVFADISWVVAMSVDGGVLECRPGNTSWPPGPART